MNELLVLMIIIIIITTILLVILLAVIKLLVMVDVFGWEKTKELIENEDGKQEPEITEKLEGKG